MNEAVKTPALTVSELNECVRSVVEGAPVLRGVFVQGEISDAKLYASGHLYFSLKDSECTVGAVMFKGSYQKLRFRPDNGMKVIIRGHMSVYKPRGQYQLVAETMVPDGAGALAAAFEQLKAKLNAEGLFDPARKKPLPPHPRRIGVITSPSGAAIHDIIRVAGTRSPSTEILLFPTLVQGAEAPPYLASGIRWFNKMKNDPLMGVDLIIIGRGGGSAEDLWCFNDEALARTIAASELPVISAVGHEVDFSISDFVADRRAATPSAAAEMAVPDRQDLGRRVSALSVRMDNAVAGTLTRARTGLDRLASARVLSSPDAILRVRCDRLNAAYHRLAQASPAAAIGKGRERVDALSRRLDLSAAARVETAGSELRRLCGQLDALSPLGVLGRGYTLVQKQDGHLVPRADSVSVGDAVTIRFADGCADAAVTAVRPDTHTE